MLANLRALSGPREWLAWIALASVMVGLASMLVQAVVKAPIQLGQSLAFRTAFVLVFGRIAYRLVTPGGALTYWAVAVYAAPGLACLWAMADALRQGRERP